ncbi:MAG: Rpn family recombination-promoting nuclease/putative transposase, partial [Bacteroidales bacterium]
RDVKNCIDSAEEKGRAEGREEGRAEGLAEGLAKGQAEGERAKAIEIAKQLLAMHLPVESITKATGLSSADITALK